MLHILHPLSTRTDQHHRHSSSHCGLGVCGEGEMRHILVLTALWSHPRALHTEGNEAEIPPHT